MNFVANGPEGLRATSPNRGDGEYVDRMHLVLNLPYSIENTFYFEIFFLNSKFHEICEYGGYLYLQGRRGGCNELHLGSELFHI